MTADAVALGAGSSSDAIRSDPAYNPGFGPFDGDTAAGEFSIGSTVEPHALL